MIAALAGGLGAAGCRPPDRSAETPTTVFAAASLAEALGDIAVAYRQATGGSVRLSFAASGAVARQVEQGAPAGVVVLADPVWMDRLETAQRIAPGSRIDLVRNHLALIARAGAETTAEPFRWLAATGGRLAIGDPGSVPAGAYARAWLRSTGAWESVSSRLVMAADVRGVRTFVARGEAGLGVVYVSDTVADPRVMIVGRPAPGEEPEIVYPAAVTRLGGERGRAFLAFARGVQAQRIFLARGFEPVP